MTNSSVGPLEVPTIVIPSIYGYLSEGTTVFSVLFRCSANENFWTRDRVGSVCLPFREPLERALFAEVWVMRRGRNPPEKIV